MARPRKEGRFRMDRDIRIPLTDEQKAEIVEAARSEPEGMAAWARAILLAAARDQNAKGKAGKPRGRGQPSRGG